MAEKAVATGNIMVGDTDVHLRAEPLPDGAVRCELKCNGRLVIVTFNPNGDVDTDVQPPL